MRKVYIFALCLCLLLGLAVIQKSSAAKLEKASIEVFADGVTHFKALISAEETEASVTLPLFAPQNRIFNLVALDEENLPLSYEIDEQNITVNSLGAVQVTIEYDTDFLTLKEAGLWTLSLYAPFELEVTLPENSTIIYINAVPASVTAKNGSVMLSLSPGFWEVCYEVSFQSYQPMPKPTPQQRPSGQAPFPVLWVLASAIVAVSAVVLILYFTRRRNITVLRFEEVEVLKFIKERGGRALEAELRNAFPDIPRTSMWRLIKRLERRGKVKVKKVGLQNVVELV
ncbi:MAG: hypothetical protein QXN87_06785 [Candidatus Bathyarchaeia archaeon]